MEIDRPVLGKVDLSPRAPRLQEAAGVIGARETDAVDSRAVAQFAERRVEPEIEKIPGICSHRPVHSHRFPIALADEPRAFAALPVSEAEGANKCQAASVSFSQSASM
jgi:hypothetical protein